MWENCCNSLYLIKISNRALSIRHNFLLRARSLHFRSFKTKHSISEKYCLATEVKPVPIQPRMPSLKHRAQLGHYLSHGLHLIQQIYIIKHKKMKGYKMQNSTFFPIPIQISNYDQLNSPGISMS